MSFQFRIFRFRKPGDDFDRGYPGSWGSSYPSDVPAGWIHYRTDLGTYAFWNGSAWTSFGGGGGSGDVVGPASSTDNAVARFDGSTGKLLQNSVVIIDDSGNTSGMGTLNSRTIANFQDGPLTGDVTTPSASNAAATIANDAVSNAKAADMASSRIKGRVTAGSGDPEDLTQAQVDTVMSIATTSTASSVPRANVGGKINTNWLDNNEVVVEDSFGAVGDLVAGDGSNSWEILNVGNDNELLQADSGETTGMKWIPLTDRFILDHRGSSFPSTSLTDGQPFYHTTHQEWFHYSSALSAWLSYRNFDYFAKGIHSPSATSYLRWDQDGVPLTYSATAGMPVPHDMVVIDMGLWVFSSSTATVFVRDDGTNVTGASIAVAAATSATATKLNSSTIAAGSILSFAVTSGTLTSAYDVRAHLKRIET